MSTQGPEPKGKDLLAMVGKTIKAGAATIYQETKDLTRIGKLKLELMSLENERGRKLEELGRVVHGLHKDGVAMPEELNQLIAAVDGILARIEAKNAEIDNVRAEAGPREAPRDQVDASTSELVVPEASLPPRDEVPSGSRAFCQECGARLNQGDVFCSRCGIRL
ncbi:MAG: zinc ribbon domain-containing protein [Bacillota bacterium]|jgi:hypothetical protein